MLRSCAITLDLMTRRDIILQILAEASGRSLEQAGELFDAMVAHDLMTEKGMEQQFSPEEGERLLGEFRQELPGIRRWLAECGLLDPFGNA